MQLHRRDLLAGAVALAAAPARAATARGFIDVHHHFTPPGGYVSPGAPWSPQRAIEEMDRNGVATGVGFLGPLGAAAAPEANRKLARQWNEFGAGVRRDNPKRFGLFAAVPMADADGALAEMAYAYDTLKADGLGIVTNYGDLWLGDARFDPIWQEANRRKAVVYVHPTDAPCCTPASLSYMADPLSGPWIEWPMNTARTIVSLMRAGVLRKYPGIRFIFSHGGGLMPMLIERLDGMYGWTAVGRETLGKVFPDGVAAEFAKLHFECAQAYSEVNIGALMKLAPTSQILFGTDYDRFPISHSVERFARLTIDPRTAAAIARGNAERLFPRLTAAAG